MSEASIGGGMAACLSEIETLVKRGERISSLQAKQLYLHANDELLQELANIVRARFHEPGTATYLLMRIINYTNVCVAKCDYCSFYRLPRANDAYLRSKEWIFAKIDELIAVGGDFFGFNGGFNPELKIEYYCDLFSAIREKYQDKIEFYALTVVELIYIARVSRISVPEALSRLKQSGVRWITGGGAEVLADSFRQRHSPLKYSVAEYMEAQGQILDAGLKSTATMVIGFDETIEERLEHLETVRRFQDERKGELFSFLPWTYKPYNNELGGVEISPQEYLRHIALCRIFLDNIAFLRTSVLTQNANALKGLRYGANDFDIPWEDEVTEKAGAHIDRDIEKILKAARDEGFTLKYRQIANKDRQDKDRAAPISLSL